MELVICSETVFTQNLRPWGVLNNFFKAVLPTTLPLQQMPKMNLSFVIRISLSCGYI